MAGMVVKNNMSAINTLNTLNKNTKALSKSLKQVSSGMKINTAADDASGYAISERMRVQIRSLSQAIQNTQNGMSLMKVAEGAVSSTVDILRTMKAKAIDAANDTNTNDDRQIIQKEFDQYIQQIDDNANVTYNGIRMLDASHNSARRATATVLANDYLDKHAPNATNSTTFVPLTELKSKYGENLGILASDKITVSVVQLGKTYTRTYDVGNKDLNDIYMAYITDFTREGYIGGGSLNGAKPDYGVDGFGNRLPTLDGLNTSKISTASSRDNDPLYAIHPGLDYQLGGVTFNVSDRYGNMKKSVNAILDNYNEVVRAENASEDNALVFQVGTKAGQSIKVGLSDMRAYALALTGKDGSTVSIGTQENANAAIGVLDNALSKVLNQQTTIGAIQSRLEYTAANLTTASENVTSAESVIRDADMAKSMTEYTKHNVLLQAAQSMLAQANQNSSNVLSLLQ